MNNRKLTKSCKIMHLVLAMYFDGREASPSELAAIANCSERTVYCCIDALLEANYISRQRVELSRFYIYTVLVPPTIDKQFIIVSPDGGTVKMRKKSSRYIVFEALQRLLAQTPDPTVEQIAEQAGYDPQTVRRVLQILENEGVIRRERGRARPGRPYRYQVMVR
jgi:DNA-binding MarR family transcriptional regulator